MSGEFADLVADPPAAAAPAPTASVTPEELSAHVHALISAHASAASIKSYIAAHGYENTQGVDEAVAYRDNGGQGVNVVVNNQAANPGQPAPAPVAHDDFSDLIVTPQPEPSIGRSLGLGARAVAQGIGAAADFPTRLVTAPINAALDALGVPGHEQTGQDAGAGIANAVGLPRPVNDGERLMSAGVQGAASALPMMALGGPMAAAPIAQTIGAATGGAASEAARQGGASPLTQAALGVGGAMLGAGGVIGAGAALNRGASVASPTMQAFDRLQIPAMAADVGGTTSKMATSVTKMTLGGIPLAEAANNSVAAARAAREAIAGNIGPVSDTMGAGTAAQSGARAWMKASASKATKLYDAIPIAADRGAVLSSTRAALDKVTVGLPSNPALSAKIADPTLQAYKDALAKGGLSWQDLKAFRTYVGEKAGGPAMQSDTSQKSLKGLYGALSDDMRATAAADGQGSLQAFNRANQFYRGRQARIDNVLTPLLGKDMNKSGEAAFRQIESWAGNTGDVARLAVSLRSMPADEAATVRASLFNKLGDANPGAQTAAGDVFSPATFVTHWSKLSMRAKSALFPGADYRQSIDDLVTAADAMKSAEKFANVSKTGLAVNVGGHVAGLFTNPMATIAAGVGEFGAGKLLASPRFARWAASSRTRPNGAAQLAHINRLSAIAAAEPSIATGVLTLQERLAAIIANDNGLNHAAAATPSGQEGQAVDGN